MYSVVLRGFRNGNFIWLDLGLGIYIRELVRNFFFFRIFLKIFVSLFLGFSFFVLVLVVVSDVVLVSVFVFFDEVWFGRGAFMVGFFACSISYFIV